jgi:hypothetical protein
MQRMSIEPKGMYGTLAIFVAMMLLVSGCGALKPQPAALTNEQLGQVTENILKALEQGNYTDFSRDFSDQMRAAFPEEQFNKLRDLLQNASGKHISCGEASLLNNQGYAVYRFPCKFDKEDVTVTITLKINGDKVEGLFFDSQNLRKQSQ